MGATPITGGSDEASPKQQLIVWRNLVSDGVVRVSRDPDLPRKTLIGEANVARVCKKRQRGRLLMRAVVHGSTAEFVTD
jgi:hypothetical protein